MGVSRNGKRITERLRKLTLLPGDILLLLSQKDRAEDVLNWLKVLSLADTGTKLTANSKTTLAIILFAAAILSSAIGLIYLPIALGLLIVFMS